MLQRKPLQTREFSQRQRPETVGMSVRQSMRQDRSWEHGVLVIWFPGDFEFPWYGVVGPV